MEQNPYISKVLGTSGPESLQHLDQNLCISTVLETSGPDQVNENEIYEI